MLTMDCSAVCMPLRQDYGEAHRVISTIRESDGRFSPGHCVVKLNEIFGDLRVRERQPENLGPDIRK